MTIFKTIIEFALALVVVIFFTPFLEKIFTDFGWILQKDRTKEDEEEMIDSAERAQAFSELIDKLSKTYPDAKHLSVKAYYEFVEDEDGYSSELCPNVSIEIER